MKTRCSTTVVATAIWLSSMFAYPVLGTVTLVNDERSLATRIVDYWTGQTSEYSTTDPDLQFNGFQVYSSDATIKVGETPLHHDILLIAAAEQTSVFTSGGFTAIGKEDIEQPVFESGFGSTALSESIFKIGFVLDQEYAFSTRYFLNATIEQWAWGYPMNSEAGYKLTGPSGEVFSFLAHPDGVPTLPDTEEVIATQAGRLAPGNYVVEAWARSSGETYKEPHLADAQFAVTLQFTPVPDGGCTAGLCTGAVLGLFAIQHLRRRSSDYPA